MPKISVIVPVYNVEVFLKDCIESVLGQSFTDFELLLVDDGSSDSSGEICDHYAEKDDRIRVFHRGNQGQSQARNFGIKQAEADWISFVDSDDIIHFRMLEILYERVQSSNTAICACSALESSDVQQFFESEINIYFEDITIDEKTLDTLFENVPYVYWVVWGKLIKKEILLKYPFVRGRIYEDNAVVCRWIYEARKISITNDQLYFYRINPTGTTKSDFNINKCDYLWALQEQIVFLKRVKYGELAWKVCRRYLMTYSFLKNQIKKMSFKRHYYSIKLKVQALSCWLSNVRAFVKTKADLFYALEIFFPKLYLLMLKATKNKR